MNQTFFSAPSAQKACALVLGLFLMLSLWPVVAHAGSFSVSPVRIYMKPRDRAVAVTLINEGNTPVALQADIYVWTQKPDGTDELVLTEDMILSPPIIKLAPQARQVVRLALLKPMDASRQLTYRLIVREIPEATASPSSGLQVPIALALSMPVFITPPVAKREMRCELGGSATAAEAKIFCANTGSAYAQIREALLKRGDAVLARFEGGSYILPGAKKALVLGSEPPANSAANLAGTLMLHVTYDDSQSEIFPVAAP